LSYEFVKVKNEGGVVNITLDKPPLNVLNIAMMEELILAFKWAQKEHGQLVLLDAAGKAFSAGVDVADHTEDKVDDMIDVFDRLLISMFDCEKPIVCAVNGAALGGGCELVIFSDVILLSEKAKLGQPEIMVGVFPPIACYVLPHILSWPRAMELLLSGETIGAQRAEYIGLANAVLPADNFAGAVNDYIKKFLNNSGFVMAQTKKAARAGLNKGFIGGLKDIDNIYLRELMHSHDAKEGLGAFMEKRKPVWQGK